MTLVKPELEPVIRRALSESEEEPDSADILRLYLELPAIVDDLVDDEEPISSLNGVTTFFGLKGPGHRPFLYPQRVYWRDPVMNRAVDVGKTQTSGSWRPIDGTTRHHLLRYGPRRRTQLRR